MKKFLLSCTMVLSCALGVTFNAAAESDTFNFPTIFASASGTAKLTDPLTEGKTTLTFAKAPGTTGTYNPCLYYVNGEAVRVYKNNTLTFSLKDEGYFIESIEFTSPSGYVITANNTFDSGTFNATALKWTAPTDKKVSTVVMTITESKRISKIVVNYTAEAPDAVEKPVIKVDEEYNVEISCGTPGASIYYTLDDSNPTTSSTLYDGVFALSKNCTIKAIATKDGEFSKVASEVVSNMPYSCIADVNKLTSGMFTLKADMTVFFKSGSYTFLTDGKSNTLAYNPTSTVAQGENVNSVTGTAYIYNQSLFEITSAIMVKGGNGADVDVKPITTFEGIEDYNLFDVVTFSGATIPSTSTIKLGDKTLALYNRFGLTISASATQLYEVKAIIASNNNILQIWPMELTKIVEKAKPNLAFASESIEIELGEGTHQGVTLTKPAGLDVKYTSSNPAVTVSETGVITYNVTEPCEVTITATSEETTAYLADEASYVINFVAPAPKTLGEIKVNGKEVADNEELNFKVGDKLTFSAVNAESIMFEAEADSEENNASGDSEADSIEWKITAADLYQVYILAGLGEDTKEVTFFVTATEPAKPIETFAWSEESVTITQGEEYELPTFTCSAKDIEINYASSNHAVATVEDGVISLGSAVGEAIITASFDGNDEYEEAVATCKIIVKKAGVKVPEHTGMWELVSSSDEIIDGEVYVFTSFATDKTTVKEMSTTVNSNNISSNDAAFDEVNNDILLSTDKTAVVVINKVSNNGYTFYLTNGVNKLGYLTCASNASKNYLNVNEEANETASVATMEFNDEDSTVKIGFLGTTANATTDRTYLKFNYNKDNVLFACYQSTFSSGRDVNLYRVHTPAPTNVASNGTVIITAANEQHNLWYRVKGGASAKEGMRFEAAAEQPFISADSHTVTLNLTSGQSVDYYSEYLGRRSAVMNVDYTGNTTGIDEVTSENDATVEWYDLAGRHVAAPSKGIFIKKYGNAVTKHMFQ